MVADPITDPNGTAHVITRILQVLTLIPCWALLAAVIDHYNRNDAVTPGEITFLFVVALLASVWSFCILITHIRARNTALWMTFFDVVAMSLLIAAVVVLSDMANADCVAVEIVDRDPSSLDDDVKYYPEDWNSRIVRRGMGILSKRQNNNNNSNNGSNTYRDHCGEIKAAWGLAIANIILFFVSAILTAVIYRENQEPTVIRREKVYVDPTPVQPSPVAMPPPVFEDPYYAGSHHGSRRHSRGHKSHRSHRSHRSSRSYGGSRRGSVAGDYYA